MIPLVLVTGFLGSGKTTLLEHLARRHQGRNIVWLVNEFSARDIDAARLAATARDVLAIAGGSIFCRCKASEFLDLLGTLPDRFHPELVIIEASGMADPLVAGKMLRESGLDRLYAIRSVIAIVDPDSFRKLLHTLPNIRSQVEAATQVLVNKTDLHPQAAVEATEAAIREINPDVPLIRTRFAEVDLDLAAVASPDMDRGELAPCVDPNFVTYEISPVGELDLAWLQRAVAREAADVFRLKGIAQTRGQLHRLDYSASGWRIEEITGSPPAATPTLVLIARGPVSEAVRELVQALSGDFTPAIHSTAPLRFDARR